MQIRHMRESDAEAFIALRRHILTETPYMLREPDEFTITLEEMQREIRDSETRGYHLMLVAEQDGQLAGFLTGARGELRRIRHTLYLAIGILQAFAGQGLGTQLFATMEQWARQQGITRLDLTVQEHNKAGIALYKKCGFEIEGLKRHSLIINGEYASDYIMGKLLDGK